VHQASQWNDDNEKGGSSRHAFLSPHARAASARVTTHLPSPSHEVKISTVAVGALSILGCMQGQPMCGRQRTCISSHEVTSPGQARYHSSLLFLADDMQAGSHAAPNRKATHTSADPQRSHTSLQFPARDGNYSRRPSLSERGNEAAAPNQQRALAQKFCWLNRKFVHKLLSPFLFFSFINQLRQDISK
jgi:hypothetical protein